jgi:HSP20 family molecular chaperone IbpA
LPAHFEPEKIKAVYEHGVLTIHLAKDEAVKEHTIQVQVKQAVSIR